MTIIEKNKLLAEFLGLKKDSPNTNWYYWLDKGRYFRENEINFDTDYNWLMPLVYKIEELGYEVLIGRISCNINSILDRENPISSMVCGDVSKKQSIVYETCVKFVEWYNKQNK